MSYKYIKIIAALLCICMLSACAGADKQAAAPVEQLTEESCTAETPETEAPKATEEPWLNYAVNSPELAEKLARAEIKKMQELGLLSEELYIKDGPADYVEFFCEPEFMDRTDRPFFAVRWYLDSWYGNNWEGENRYTIVSNLDAQSGKIMFISIEAAADEDAEVKYEIPVENGYFNEETGEMEKKEEIWLYHENFSDIFDVEMSTNAFCDLLCEYWGFESWTLGGGGALNLAIPLKELTAGTTGYYYVAFTFEGDEPGKHMYVQLNEFPGRVNLMFGTDHAHG